MSSTTLTAPVGTAAERRPLAEALPAALWLGLGVVATVLVANRFHLALVGWIAAVPWLIYLRQTDGWRSRVAFLAALQLGLALQIAKIVTDPIPWIFVPMFSVPMALFGGVLYVVFEWARRRLGDGWGLVLFPALVTASEWIGWSTSEFGSWGASAYTQLDNLPLLQLTSLVGMGGIAFLTGASSALGAVVLASERPSEWMRPVAGLLALIVAAHAWGAARLLQHPESPMVTVAAVVTDVSMGAGGLPSQAELDAGNDRLFARSERAAEAGAALIVWNEGATAVQEADEEALVARGQALAEEHGVDLVLAFVVPVEGMHLFENKYVWLTPEGPIETYFKHHPVPSEGSVKGTDPIQVLERPYGAAAGAICYDYDFPGLGREHGRLGADLVFVPSSDWAGIDPTHTWMARVRGIESGHAVIRPVRWATSAAFDAYGRTLASMPWQDDDHLMLARVPVTPMTTVYARIGDVLPWTSLGIVCLALGLAFRVSPGGRRR